MKPNAQYKAFSKRFTSICERFGGVCNARDAIGYGLSFDIPTPLGPLKASIHCDSHGNRRTGYYIECVFLRFKEYSTGKVYDSLYGYDFNGCSGKWNILCSGESLQAVRDSVLVQLEWRLETVCSERVAE